MSRVVTDYSIGKVLTDRSPENVAREIQNMLDNTEQYLYWQQNTKLASQKLCWENEENVLLKLF